MERQSINFELETVKNGPSSEVWTTDLIHQAAYRDNTLGLPSLCPEENIPTIQRDELMGYLAGHYLPTRMVLAGVNVDHDRFVGLAREWFGRTEPVWGGGGTERTVDHSISQYTGGSVKVQCVCSGIELPWYNLLIFVGNFTCTLSTVVTDGERRTSGRGSQPSSRPHSRGPRLRELLLSRPRLLHLCRPQLPHGRWGIVLGRRAREGDVYEALSGRLDPTPLDLLRPRPEPRLL